MISDERRLHPAATVIDAIRHARSVAVGAIAITASQGLTRGAVIVGVFSAIAVVAAVLSWRTTRYAVVDGSLRLRTGVLSRKEQNIPATRISALDTSRGILQRMFGVVALQVQTAGGGKEAEVNLRAVSFAEAERLRAALGHRGAEVGDAAPPEPSPDEPELVYAITPRELLVAALTSPSIALASAAVAAVGSIGQDALPRDTQRQLARSLEQLAPSTVVAIVAGAILAALAVSVVGNVLLFGGFRVTRDDRRLRVRRGLLTERASTIPIDRIHGVRLVESPLRQALGYASIEVEVAGYAGQDEVTRTVVPLVRREAVAALLRELVPEIVEPAGPFERIPARARRRYLTPGLLIAAPFAVTVLALPIGLWRIAAVVFPIVAITHGLAAARAAGWQVEANVLALRWRGFARVTLLADIRRLQRLHLSRSPLQRRAALASFGVRLSNARKGGVRHLDDEVAEELLRVAQAGGPRRAG